MAYIDRASDPRRRSTAIAAVVAIHALLAYVIVTGLAGQIAHRKYRDPFTGTQMPLPPVPPPPPPTPTPHPRQSVAPERPVAPENPFFPPQPRPTVAPFDPAASPQDGLPTGLPTSEPSPLPSPTLAFKPKPPVPTNAPASWIGTDDYPARDLRENNEGVAAFRVVVGSNGRVSACEIVRSSGHPGLDAATCRLVTARARFRAATDENGETVVGTYANSVRWQIPR